MTTYNGVEVEEVTVTALVTFRAYAARATPDTAGEVWREEKIGQDIADAIEFHGPRLTDFEAGDALAGLVHGGSGDAVHIRFVEVRYAGEVAELDVSESAEATAAWL